ncbi:MAG: hypothetical protein ACKO96_47120, partial [Flammeovirgaceae bacterium]
EHRGDDVLYGCTAVAGLYFEPRSTAKISAYWLSVFKELLANVVGQRPTTTKNYLSYQRQLRWHG